MKKKCKCCKKRYITEELQDVYGVVYRYPVNTTKKGRVCNYCIEKMKKENKRPYTKIEAEYEAFVSNYPGLRQIQSFEEFKKMRGF